MSRFSLQTAVTYTTGARLMTIFGTIWAALTLIGLDVIGRIVLGFCAICTTFLLLRGTATLFRMIQSTSHTSLFEQEIQEETHRKRGRGWFLRYDVALTIQLTVIGLVDVVLGLRDLSSLIVPATALLIGLHMLHLAAIFSIRLYSATGLLLALLALLALIAIPTHALFADPYQWSTLLGIYTAILFWGTALLLLRKTRRDIAAY